MSVPALQLDPYLSPPLARHRIDVETYHRMGEAGLLRPEQRTELIEGEVIDMAPIGSPHAGNVNFLLNRLLAAIGSRAIVAAQNPIVLGRHSEPQPDLCVLRPREDFYIDAHPTAADVLLAVEVSDTTLAYDRGVKLPLYARHGIPEYWLVDLTGGRLEAHHTPRDGEYRHMDLYRDERICLQALPEVCIELAPLRLTKPK
ncbi:Uma2 family endonuclease [Endothiovibrio diazotrophicus]